MHHENPLGPQIDRPELMALLQAAAGRQMTYAERIEQAVSYVYGQMDANSHVTKDEVRHVIYGYLGMQAELRIQDM